MKKWLLLLGAILLAVFPVSRALAEGLSRDHTYGYQQSASAVLPIVKRDSLLNGLQLVLLEGAGTGSVSVRLRINSGAMFDLAGKGGLADLTAGMLLKGGGGNDAKTISDTVEQMGLTIQIDVNWDSTDIIIGGPADSLEAIFDLLGKMVIRPAFDQRELADLKARRIEELKSVESDDGATVRRKALDLIFGHHPFGRPLRGTTESLPNIKQTDLQFFHSRYYLANNSELIVSGDATMERVTRLGRSKLGAWKKGEKIPATFRPPDNRSRTDVLLLDRKGATDAHAAIAQIGISRLADNYFASLVMGEILTNLARKAAEPTGATITTEFAPRYLPGPILIEIASAPDRMTGAIGGVLSVMKSLQSRPAEVEEVERAKERIISSFKERLRTNEGAAEVLLDVDLYGLGRDYLINYVGRVSAITPADVQKAAATLLTPDSTGIVVAGPREKIESTLKDKGTVTVMP